MEVIRYNNYNSYKVELTRELQKSAESFVKIGYLLKVARDTNILDESEYSTVVEFAQAEYGIDKTMVSRFIRINDKFSVDGYSEEIQEQYRGFGYAKLAIMLQLPDSINNEITPIYTKSEIQAIRDEVEEEKKVSDIEVMLEEPKEEQQFDRTIDKILHQLGHDEPELYVRLNDAVMNTVYDGTALPVIKKIVDAIAPSGEVIKSIRIQGIGRLMLSIKGAETEPNIINIRTGEKEQCSWDSFIDAMEKISKCTHSGKESWSILYGETFPENEIKKEEVAPVQQRQETRKQPKVTKAKTENNTRKRIKELFEEDAEKKETERLEAGVKEDEEEQEAAVVEEKVSQKDYSEDQVEIIDESSVDLRSWKAWTCNDQNQSQIIEDISRTIYTWVAQGKSVTITANAKELEC